MKRCSAPLVINKMKTIKESYTLTDCQILKFEQVLVWILNLGNSHTAGGIIRRNTLVGLLENSLALPSKV